MFPVERTPHAKRAAQVRRTMAEMYEDPKEKEKQAEDRARYGEELRQQMVEQRAQRQRQRDALKKADEYYYQRAQAQANNKNNSGGAQQQQQQQQQQRRVEASTSQATLRRPVPHVPSLVGHSQIREIQQQQQRAAPRINQLDRLQEYPWQAGGGSGAKVGADAGSGSILHQQSMDWLRIPRGYYGGLSQGPLEGLKRLRRELMVEYQQLGGDAAGLLEQQKREGEERERQRHDGAAGFNVFSGGRRPPNNNNGAGAGGLGYKPDQLDRWISDFQHKKLGRAPGGYGAGAGAMGPPQGTMKGGRFGGTGRAQGRGLAYGTSPSLKADSELIYL